MGIAEAQLVRAVGELQKEGKFSDKELRAALGKFIRRRRLSRRTGKISRALDAYTEAESGVLSVVATSAHPLTETEQKFVILKAAGLLGKPGSEVNVIFSEDPALVGGIRLETTDTRYDATITRAIKELRKSL